MFAILLISVFIVMFALKLYNKLTCGMCRSYARMSNKVVIVTGANTGIGYETAKELASRDALVILACRDEKKGLQAREKIIESTGNNKVVFKKLDLASFASVRNFCDDILKMEPAIHVLINNAGTGKLDNALTVDNLPVEVQVNHFGPFLLTLLLLPLIKSSAPSRIINVSSVMHRFGKIDLETFHKQAKTSLEHRRVYSNTKLANMLFTLKLSRVLKGTGVTVNSLHPGGVSTEIFRHQPSIVKFLLDVFLKTPYEGAQTSIYLAVDPDLQHVTGKYFSDCHETTPADKAQDMVLANKLWELSEKIVNLNIKNE